jgi:hypothetical protein
MENVMLFYVVLYMILGLVIYHSIFEIWYFNFGKAMIKEIFGAFIFALLMTGLTLKFWWLALIIIVLIGLVLSAKVQNPTGKKVVLGVFVVVAVITAIAGINYNRQDKEKESDKMTQEESASESYSEDEDYYEDSNDEDEDEPIYSEEDSEQEDSYDEDNSEYIIANSSQVELTEEDLQGLSAQELTYARNEIYARHGYIFNSSELNEYFNSKSWYQADDSFSGTLEGVEQKNAAFISEYQTQNGLEYSPQ